MAAGLLEVQLSAIVFPMKIYGVNGGPLNYSQMMVTLADGMIHIHHIKLTKYTLHHYLIYTVVSTNQAILYRVPWGQFWPKNEVYHISFEGVPAQYHPIYLTTQSILS